MAVGLFIFMLLVVVIMQPIWAFKGVLWLALLGWLFMRFARGTGSCLAHRIYGSVEEIDEMYRDGKCGHCGYDLRETPERCPECGRAVPEEFRSSLQRETRFPSGHG